MRVKLLVCGACHRCMEDDGQDLACVGEADDRHKRTMMVRGEFVRADVIEPPLALLLDSCGGVDEIQTPAGPFALDPLREAYDAVQW